MDAIEGLRGAAIVTRGGRVQLAAAAGPADAGTGVACTPRTRFQIASVSKQFTAAAALLLAESGRLDLAGPVSRWLPDGPAQWQQVTLHHLLTHTAGVRHWGDAPGFDASQPMDLAERLALIQQAPLLTGPGTNWHYSSPGFLLAGQIVARAAGQPYHRFLAGAVLDPLGLTEISAGGIPAGAPAARGHRDGEPVPSWPLSAMPGTGDLSATVGDLARFTTALYSGVLFGPRARQAMLTPHAPLPAKQDPGDGWETYEGYGYGVFLGRLGGHVAYLHPGDNPGYQSLAVWLPGPQACVVILSNDEAADITALLRQLMPAALASGER